LQNTLNNLIGIKDTSPQPIIKSSARNYAPPVPSEQKSIKTIMNENIGIKNTSVKPIIRSSAKGFLSEDERRSIKKINDPYLTSLMNLGDRASKQQYYRDEMEFHRKAQEVLRGDHKIVHTNFESKDSFGYNSAAVHNPDYTDYFSSLGYKHSDIFYREKPLHCYKPNEKVNYIPKWLEQFKRDPVAISWLNSRHT
jgi:hypothetical protein